MNRLPFTKLAAKALEEGKDIAGYLGFKGLSRQNAGQQAGCSSAVAHIQDVCRGGESVKALPVDKHGVLLFFNIDPQCPEAADRGKTVCAFQKISDLCISACDRAKHDAAVGDGFVSWNADRSLQSCNTA